MIEDPKFIARLQRRDEAAFNAFVREHQPMVFSLVLRMLGNRAEAEDLTQEIFISIFKAIDSFRGESKFSTWIFRIALNHCKNRMKYLGRRHTNAHREFEPMAERDLGNESMTSTVAQVERPDRMAEGKELEQIVRRALSEIDEEFRELIVLRDIENLPYEEIQVITGLADGTMKSRLHRARLALQKRVTELQTGLHIGEKK